MQHMKVDCLIDPKALPAPNEEQPTKKYKTLTICRVYECL